MKLTYSAAVRGDTVLGGINFIPETPEETFLFETLSRNAAVRWWGASPEGGYSIVFEDIYKLRAQGLDPDRPAEKLFVIPKEELEEMRLKVAGIKKEKAGVGMRSNPSEQKYTLAEIYDQIGKILKTAKKYEPVTQIKLKAE